MDAVKRLHSPTEVSAILERVEKVLSGSPKNKEAADVLRHFLQLLIVQGREPSSQMSERIYSWIISDAVPVRLRTLCLHIAREFGPPLDPVLLDSPATIPAFCVPLVLSLGVPEIDRTAFVKEWLNHTVDEVITRKSNLCLSFEIGLRFVEDLAPDQSAIFEASMVEGMESAAVTTVEESTSLWKKSAVSVPVTELDGSVAKDFFTLLNCASSYAGDQLFNIRAFSSARLWLSRLYLSPNGNASSRRLSTGLKGCLINYCRRVLGQVQACQASSDQGAGSGVKIAPRDRELLAAVTVEVIRILDALCRIDPALVGSVYGDVSKVAARNNDARSSAPPSASLAIALVEFYHHHAEAAGDSAEPAFSAFFPNVFAAPSVGVDAVAMVHDTWLFLEREMASLCAKGILSRYAPCVLRAAAWRPTSHVHNLLTVLPALIGPDTAEEVFHLILDLPAVCHAEELQMVEAQGEIPAKFRVLYSYLLRTESGSGSNFWENPKMLGLLFDLSLARPASSRVVAVARVVPVLLERFFDVVLSFAPASCASPILNVVMARIDQLFLLRFYREAVVDVLAAKVLPMFDKWPHLVCTHKAKIISLLQRGGEHPEPIEGHPSIRSNMSLNLCWAIGEHVVVSPPTNDHAGCSAEDMHDFVQAVQLCIYETIAVVEMECSGGDDGSSDDESDDDLTDNHVERTRFLHSLISTSAKLSSRSQPLVASSLVCFAKLLSHERVFRKYYGVVALAEEYSALLRHPGVAAACFRTTSTGSDERMGGSGIASVVGPTSPLSIALIAQGGGSSRIASRSSDHILHPFVMGA